MIRRVAVAATAGALALVPSSAEAKISPYPVPCRSCSYVASATCKMPTPGYDDWLVGFVRYDVNRRGRVHVRTVAWIGTDAGGPEALDRVYAHVRISGGGERVTPVRVWDPAGYQGWWKAVDGQNGWTARGLEVPFTGHSDGESCSVTVTPRSIP